MAKSDVKTPIKRKSFGNNTPAKKVKVENGNGTAVTPKKQNQSAKKPQVKAEPDSPKIVKPFAGTKKVFPKKENQKQGKPNPTKPQPAKQEKEIAGKSKRKQFSKLIGEVKTKEGTKDPLLLKQLDEKINAIQSRGELTKTAKRKLAVLNKLKIVCEEGAAVAAAKSKAKDEAEKAAKKKTKTEKPAAVAVLPKKKQAKAVPAKKEVEEDEEDDSDEEAEAEDSGEEEQDSDEEEVEGEGDSGDEVEGEDSGEEDDDDDEEDADDDDEDDEESEEEPPAPKEKQPKQKANSDKKDTNKAQNNSKKQISVDDLKKNELLKKEQKRFVLFVGNIPFDTTKQDLAAHFSKAGEIVHIRLPNDQKTNKPRGFGYVEMRDAIGYEKCLSMHHSQIKGRRINVLYTQGGKKKGDERKKQIKAKNMKLHALRRNGQLAGSVKETQKRSFRRNKAKSSQAAQNTDS